MPVNIGIPLSIQDSLLVNFLTDLLRRTADVTAVPLFIDYTNQRVLIGISTVSSGTKGVLEVNGDVKVVKSGSGYIVPNSTAANFYRLTVDDSVAGARLKIVKV